MIMWLAPIGAFGAIAGVVGDAGWSATGRPRPDHARPSTPPASLFVVVILGALLKVATGLSSSS